MTAPFYRAYRKKDWIYGPSGYFGNMTHARSMEDIEMGFRVSHAQEDEDLGFGPLFNAQVALWEENDMTTRNDPYGSYYALKFFTYEHLPEALQAVSKPCCLLANEMVRTLPDGPQLALGLQRLLDAKDAFVRAALPD